MKLPEPLAKVVSTPAGKVLLLVAGAVLILAVIRSRQAGGASGGSGAPPGGLGDVGGSLAGTSGALSDAGGALGGTTDNSLAAQIAVANAQMGLQNAQKLSDFNFLYAPISAAEGALGINLGSTGRGKEEISQGGRSSQLLTRFDVLYEASHRDAVAAAQQQRQQQIDQYQYQQAAQQQAAHEAAKARNPFASIGNFLGFAVSAASTLGTGGFNLGSVFGGGSRRVSTPSLTPPAGIAVPAGNLWELPAQKGIAVA